eukprot:gene13202-14491_t
MSRSTNLAYEASHEFRDPISLDLMKDPVIAADGHSYDRQTITNWFAMQRAQGRPITSPRTNLRLKNDSLTPNPALKRELEIFIASISTIRQGDIQFTLSSDIFKELDRLSSMPEMGLFDFEPPKIVVLGNESHGKSTILERVIGLPLFPKEKGICTRCVVRVHMRRSVPGQPSLAEVSIQKVLPRRKKEVAPLSSEIVALDNIREKIKEVMDDLVRRDPQRRMIIDDHEIIVKINLPYCLNVDILDLPGLVTTSPASTTQNLPQVTKEIAMRVIGEQRESSFFLLVNDVRVPANQSRGCEVVQEAKIEGQTLGIFTKVDTFVSDDGSEALELQQLLDSSRGGFPLGYGWMAAASRSVDKGGTTNKLQVFQLMEQNESRCLEERYRDLVAMNKMGIQQIRQRIQTLYESFIRDRWIPVIRSKLFKHIANCRLQLQSLGTPLPPDKDYIAFIGEKNKLQLTIFNEEWIQEFYCKVLQRLLSNCEKELIMVQDDKPFWRLMDNYHWFIGDEDDRMAYHECMESARLDVKSQSPGKSPQLSFSLGNEAYKFGIESFERDIPAIGADIALENLKMKLIDALKELYKQLYNRINPDGQLMNLIHLAVIKMATKEDTKFKLERFEILHSALVQVVASQFQTFVKSFDDWFGEFISSINEKSLLHCVYYRKEDVRCKLYWSHPNELRRYPHMILDRFYQLIRENLTRAPLFSIPKSVDITSLEEGCKKDRLRCFEEIKQAIEVREAVKEFAHKVLSELEAIRQH